MPHQSTLEGEQVEERRLRTSEHERYALFGQTTENAQGIPLSWLLLAIIGLVLAIVLFAPKIYLANNIYYTSRTIQKLKGQEDLLKEEKRQLQLQLEKQRYKYSVENMP
ncbi:hypothetical protein [Helicobacter cynogastricus]|uniref:hypothetical protein n=1 Tax=Helicobacter cynogastricus TaxID=329937 RepID=UPI000CF1A73D|nr:hypothetical protein [Helicobacter cynogastricus]